MKKMTLLEMTQNILSSMNSDEVNSIGDTVESLQVAEEVRNTFYELYSNRDIPEFEGLITLEPSGEDSQPHVLRIPDNVAHIKWVKYIDEDHRKYRDLYFMDTEEFVNRIIEEELGAANPYAVVNLLPNSPVQYTIRANKSPHFYTMTNDNQYLVCDSFHAGYESHLTSAKSLAWGVLYKEFVLQDTFVPPIDANLFPHLLAEAKSACFINIKEVANSKEEQRARRQLIRTQTRVNRDKNQRGSIYDGYDFSRKR